MLSKDLANKPLKTVWKTSPQIAKKQKADRPSQMVEALFCPTVRLCFGKHADTATF